MLDFVSATQDHGWLQSTWGPALIAGIFSLVIGILKSGLRLRHERRRTKSERGAARLRILQQAQLEMVDLRWTEPPSNGDNVQAAIQFDQTLTEMHEAVIAQASNAVPESLRTDVEGARSNAENLDDELATAMQQAPADPDQIARKLANLLGARHAYRNAMRTQLGPHTTTRSRNLHVEFKLSVFSNLLA